MMYNSGDSTIEFPGTQNCPEMEKYISETLGTKLQTFHNSIVSQFPEELEHKENKTKYRKMTRKPRSHVRILICTVQSIKFCFSLSCKE